MKRLIVSALFVCATAVATVPAHAADVNLNVYPFSWRQMSDSYWSDIDIDKQYALGGMVDFGEKGSHLHFVAGLHTGVGAKDFSNPLLNDVLATTSELSFGMTGVWHNKSACPFISGGLSFVRAELEFDVPGGTVKDNDDALGFFVEGGVYWRLGAHFNLGLHGRLLAGTSITLFGNDTDVDYWQVGPMIGWSWPKK